MTPAATSAFAAMATSLLFGFIAHTMRIVKVAILAMLNPKQSALGRKIRLAARFFWNIVICVTPTAKKHAIRTAEIGISTPRVGKPPNRRSEERRVGKECRARWWAYGVEKKQKG